MSVNSVHLLGFLGKDPETTMTQAGKQITKFSLATTERYNNENHTSWHNIVLFGQPAKFAADYLKKGNQIYLEGKINYSEWEKEDGTKMYKTEITGRDIKNLTKKEDSGSGGNTKPAVDTDEMPF